MSVTMTKTEGVSVHALTSDPQSALLCYSPVCCSVSQHLKKIYGSSQSVLGALQIMIGLLNIGLGAILISVGDSSGWRLNESMCPFWLGGLFILFGAVDIWSEKHPSPCLVILNAIFSVLGVGFAIAAIVLYVMNIDGILVWLDCIPYEYYGIRQHTTPAPSPEEMMMRRKCQEMEKLTQMILQSISAVLIVLAALELCVTISSAVLGIKALCRSEKRKGKSPDDQGYYKPLLEEVTSNPAA